MQKKTLELLIKRPALWIVVMIAMVVVSFALYVGSGYKTMFWISIPMGVLSLGFWYVANLFNLERPSVLDSQVPKVTEVRAWINLAVPLVLTILASSHMSQVSAEADTVTLVNGAPVASGAAVIWISPLQDEVV